MDIDVEGEVEVEVGEELGFWVVGSMVKVLGVLVLLLLELTVEEKEERIGRTL